MHVPWHRELRRPIAEVPMARRSAYIEDHLQLFLI
jgi:hypothetical protein